MNYKFGTDIPSNYNLRYSKYITNKTISCRTLDKPLSTAASLSDKKVVSTARFRPFFFRLLTVLTVDSLYSYFPDQVKRKIKRFATRKQIESCNLVGELWCRNGEAVGLRSFAEYDTEHLIKYTIQNLERENKHRLPTRNFNLIFQIYKLPIDSFLINTWRYKTRNMDTFYYHEEGECTVWLKLHNIIL